ncbi:hypothetical protein [Glycomyces niveus]|uniref:Uncharacterized protein n=1 Tax=Glycomyces niveus TaxID=2820287 RepID=A0ABS3U7E3_9ACTN|nr:hypothetical protein [Glycomyces sp. NEAU-S30]MBO3734695.1 hypothetical protein [Glycomyces sp. NEAU-S30]
MGSLNDLAAKIEADRAAAAEVAGPINSSKGQAEHTITAMIGLGLEGSAARMRKVVDEVEEAESLRAALEGALTKAHFMVMSAIQGNMGPGAPGSGAVVPLTRIDADGAPKAGLDAIPRHLRDDPVPTGEELSGVDPSIGPFQKEHENANADRRRGALSRFGRSAVRNTDELAGTTKQAAGEFTFDIEDDFDPWGSQAQAIVEVPTGQPPVFVSRVEAEGIKAGDLLSSTIVIAAFAFEAATRLSRKKENG